MKKIGLIVFTLLSINIAEAQLKNEMDSLSYAIGVNIGSNIRNQQLDLNLALVNQAINDAVNGKALYFNEEACNSYIGTYFQRKQLLMSEQSKLKGDKFLAENKNKPNVKTTPSGLQYIVITEGTGPKPTEKSKVKVHYHGTTIDGNVFDSSIDRGEPISFSLNEVIKGWTEGVQLMSVGSKYKFFIPSELAYGAQGPPKIGPNAVLIFDVELLGIE